jgi:hypothetical protein
VEVKITPAPTSDVIRQVKLYRSYSGIKNWIVATGYGLPSLDAQSLGNEQIVHVRLGPGFDQFVASQRAAGDAENAEV